MMEYWSECIKEAFSENGIIATDEQVNSIIEWVEGAYDNIGMATGSEFIPNPESAEIDELKMKIKKLELKHERQISGVLRGVAKRRNTDISNVDIDASGLITYR